MKARKFNNLPHGRLSVLIFVSALTCVYTLSLLTAIPAQATGKTDRDDPRLSGGATTVFANHAGAYSMNAANMSSRRKGDFLIGNDFFEDPWVIAPSTTDLRDGLGPLFNVSACQSCHINDGRGHAPSGTGDDVDSLLIRLSLPPQNEHDRKALASGMQANIAEPVYGGQIQDRAIPGVPAEAKIQASYQETKVRFNDGVEVSLRRPVWKIASWGYGPPHQDITLSFRVAPPMIGLGLLEAIPDGRLLEIADPDDKNNDGVSGRPNYVWDAAQNKSVIGRFGWKAGQPSVKQQSAGAFNGDMGLTTSVFAEDGCSSAQRPCKKAPNGNGSDKHEIRDDILEFVAFYSRNLAVPARRNIDDPPVKNGQRIFRETGCNTCHTERFITAEQGKDRIELSEQTIYPYTDLLLHDMGEDLADLKLNGSPAPANEPVEHKASAREWRTPPLWGIGLAKVVSSQASFLHDGRARTLMEAVLWHGGEAKTARDKVLALNAEERNSLIQFLQSL